MVNDAENSVSLRFNYKFYDKNKINQAAKDFSNICEINEENEMLILKPKTEISPKILGLEFYNYVLCLMKNS